MNQMRLRRNILDRFGDPNDIPAWMNADWLNVRINDVQREISERTECVWGTASVSGTSTTRTYGRPQSILRIHTVEWGTSGELRHTGYDQIRGKGVEWRTATGHPDSWYMEDDRTWGAYPKVRPGSAGTFYPYGPKYATNLVNNTSTTEIPTSLHRALEEGVCHEMESVLPARQDKQSGTHLARYESELGKYKHLRPAVLTVEAPRR